MFRRIPSAFVLMAALAVAGCDEGLPTAASSRLVVDFSAAPDPGVAVPATGMTFVEDGVVVSFDWMTSLALILRTEPDQSGAVIVNIGANVVEAIEGIAVLTNPADPVRFRFRPRASSNRLEPGGEAVIIFDVWYTLPGGGGEALVSLNATLRADEGAGVTDAVQVSILP